MSTPGESATAAPGRPPRLLWNQPLEEWLVPAIIFVFCGVVAWLTTTLAVAPEVIVGHAMQPRRFPLFLCVFIAILNVVLCLQMARTPPARRTSQPLQTFASGLLIALFYPGAEYIDMFLTLAVIMFAMCLVWGERRLWVAALVAVLTPITIFFFFDLLLEVRFPRGVLTNLYYG